ncbi:MAG TPA: ABC transporter substrate-binding protein [Candidatus Limnocylindria bacterium]|nr:ABC transporter substrate-binding protein [Candidatus Limnocylindria bacterium]
MRRLAVVLLLVIFASPLVAAAQPAGKVYRVGVLSYLASDVLKANLTTVREALRHQGYVEGRNVTFEVRTSNGRLDALPELAAELVRLNVDVILAIAPLAIRAARQATSTIPIVMALGDPATFDSLARPGGNVTGVTALAAELAGKQVELLKEALPRVSRVAVLRNPEQPVHVAKLRQAEAVAHALAVRLIVVDARGPEDFDSAFATMARERAAGLIVFADGMFLAHRKHLVELAARLRLPGVYASNGFAQAGGLIAYAPDNPETYRRAASFVDRILKGANPATLPVEQPTRFELTINLATARTLGLTIPQSLLVRADHVVE